MTTTKHTALPFGGPLTSAAMNSPLSQLDTAIVAVEGAFTTLVSSLGSGATERLSTVGAAGATETIDLASGSVHDVTLTDDCTLTFAGATAGIACSFTLILRQDGTGGWMTTWPDSVVWLDGSEPALALTALTLSVLTFFTLDGGTTWVAMGGGATLDDLTDVTITAPTANDTLHYIGGKWVNDVRRWEPVTTNPGGGPELVWSGDSLVMNWNGV